MAQSNIKGMTSSLRWLSDIMSLFQKEIIKIPTNYRERVIQTKKLLESDTSGLVNSLLDFSINCASVDYTIETNNINLTEELNKWLENINTGYRGRLPTGIDALAKEYFRERWKGSSNLVLRTFWENKDGLNLPTKMFFVDGEDIVAERKNNNAVTLGDEKYFIRIDSNRENNISIPASKEELLFVQRPYDYWGVLEPVPYIIRKGLFRNLKFLTLMSEKGEYIVGRALEYLFLIKKGTEKMALEGRADMVYSPDDLKQITLDFSTLLKEKKSTGGTPTYATNFDTEVEHLIPDYKKAINESIFAPIERKILAGLGMIDIVVGTSSTRRESTLNPKPFVAEVKRGVEDFKVLISDMLKTVAEKNSSHNKYFGGKSIKMKVYSSTVEHFIDDKVRDHIRSMYDRGTVSIETYNTVVGTGHIDHKVEVNRRKMEAEVKLENLMYPHLIDNREGQGEKDVPGVPLQKKPVEENPDVPNNPNEAPPPDKKGPEKKNFRSNVLFGAVCKKCDYEFDYQNTPEASTQEIVCSSCGENLTNGDIDFSKCKKSSLEESTHHDKKKKKKKVYDISLGKDQFENESDAEERADELQCTGTHTHDVNGEEVYMPCSTHKVWEEKVKEEAFILEEHVYRTNKDLPKQVQGLPTGAKTIFRKTFNNVIKINDETTAFKIAWSAVKKVYKQVNKKWIRKTKGELEIELNELDLSELIELKKLSILGKQEKILNSILEEQKEETND